MNPASVLQTVPLVIGTILVFLYHRRCEKEKRKFEYEMIFHCYVNSIVLTTAGVLFVAAYVEALRDFIPELGAYIAIAAVVLGHMAWQTLKEKVFLSEQEQLTAENEEIEKIVSERSFQGSMSQNGLKDLLILVDIQNDFFNSGKLEVPNTESLIDPLNQLLDCARKRNCKIILTRDWHPENHRSFKGFGGIWPQHCVRGTHGAEFHSRLDKTDDMEIVNIGIDNEAPDYSAFDDARMEKIIDSKDIRTIYVAGIALEYCVLATCLSALKYGKPIIALEPYIRSGSTDKGEIERYWEELTSRGVIRAKNIAGCISLHTQSS
ncbi:MAG: isochorismatase family protein [Methylobacter sp.]|nr:isochorismatase family protein [Methylobacter sp.]